jgi:DNA-binding CsgD family transcriptional regulator
MSDGGLTSAILDGAFERPLWSTFLALLRAETGADFATMIFRPPRKPLAEALHLFSGESPPRDIEGIYEHYLSSLNLLSDFGMDEAAVCTFQDVYPPKEKEHLSFYREVVVPSGVTAARMIKVTEPTGVSAWLTISRRSGEFCKRDDDCLVSLTPVLRGALRNYVALERERYTSALARDALRHLYFAWMTLDTNGCIIEHDPEMEHVFTRSEVLNKGASGRLLAKPPQLEQDILRAIRELAKNPRARPRAFTLNWNPWLDMLLMPAVQNRLTASPRAAVIAYVHGDSWQASDRCEQLIQLFGLSPGEARLALAVSRGMSIAEAAQTFGLKTETARKYTKSIYSKTGTRGLPDLVRIVMRSGLAFAIER